MKRLITLLVVCSFLVVGCKTSNDAVDAKKKETTESTTTNKPKNPSPDRDVRGNYLK